MLDLLTKQGLNGYTLQLRNKISSRLNLIDNRIGNVEDIIITQTQAINYLDQNKTSSDDVIALLNKKIRTITGDIPEDANVNDYLFKQIGGN